MKALAEIALFTDDVVGVCAFYRTLVGAAPVAEWPGGAIFAIGDGRLLVHERAAAMADGPPNEDHFAISTPDLDGRAPRLRRRDRRFSSRHATTRGVAPRTYVILTPALSS